MSETEDSDNKYCSNEEAFDNLMQPSESQNIKNVSIDIQDSEPNNESRNGMDKCKINSRITTILDFSFKKKDKMKSGKPKELSFEGTQLIITESVITTEMDNIFG